MSDEIKDLEPVLYSLIDDEGHEHEFELLDSLELDDTTYYAFTPVYDDAQALLNDSCELIILKSDGPTMDEGGDVISIEDDEEYERVAELFTERLEEYFDIIDEFDGDDDCDCEECNHHHLS